MNNPTMPSAIHRIADAVGHAFPLPPIDAYSSEYLSTSEGLLGDEAKREATFSEAKCPDAPCSDLPVRDAYADAPCDPRNNVDDAANGSASPSSRSDLSQDVLLNHLPQVMRIQSISRLIEHDKIVNRAVLFHRTASLAVEWTTQQIDTRLHRFGLVSIRPAAHTHCHEGATRIQRLLPVTQPLPSFNLFETILPAWVADRDLTNRAAALWETLPRPLGHLVNAVLWDSGRLHQFVYGPSSLKGHHNDRSGNFRHSIEVAERARDLGRACPLASPSLLIAGGLLHDVAKAAEYRYDRNARCYRMSDRGELVGHRDTLIEWLAVARERGGVIIDEGTWLALLHMVNAARGAPGWLGLREPRSLEAELLAVADRMSGHEDLHRRCAPKEGQSGFGGYHPHLGHRTYVTREARI